MSLKDLFNSNKTVHSSSLSDSGKEVESHTFVEVKRKTASGQYFRVISNKFKVPFAFTVKSNTGSRAAQSWDGCAAV